MKTENIHYIPRIDHLRFFAAFLIMIFLGITLFHVCYAEEKIERLVGSLTSR